MSFSHFKNFNIFFVHLYNYLFFIYLLILMINNVLSYSIVTNRYDLSNTNPLNKFLREPDIIKSYKDKVVLRVYPLEKPNDGLVSNYYITVVKLNGISKFRDTFNKNNIDFSINYLKSFKNGSPFYAAIKISARSFINKNYITIIIGKHQIDLTKQIEFRIDDYINPLLECGKEYQFGVAAQLKSQKEFAYVPLSRTVITINEDGNCESIDTYTLFFFLSLFAFLFSFIFIIFVLIYGKIKTKKGIIQLCFPKKHKKLVFNKNLKNLYEKEEMMSFIKNLSKEKINKLVEDLNKMSHEISIDELNKSLNTSTIKEELKNEYSNVPKNKLFETKIARSKDNFAKNRYEEIYPYDYNRIILKNTCNGKKFKFDNSDTDSFSDYVNASYVDGVYLSKRYIATQGPIPSTINDFWRMIWQTNCHQIVMLTNVEDNGRITCEKYWPSLNESQVMNELICLCMEELVYSNYTIRVFQLKLSEDLKNNNAVDKKIYQYHFTAWPDHGTPVYKDSLIMFLNDIQDHWSYKENCEIKRKEKKSDKLELVASHPMAVHCSAGVGRSGAFILIDSILDYVKMKTETELDIKNIKVDILKQFISIRKQRVFSIENFQQYFYSYKIISEALCSQDIYDTSVEEFKNYYTYLNESVSKTNNLKNITKLEKQFNVLNKYRYETDDELKNEDLFNFIKNPEKNLIPENLKKVILPNSEENIEAVYINGFKNYNEYITTNVPSKENRYLFWLMVNSLDTDTIILLNNIEPNQIYWPNELNEPQFYKELKIELLSENKNSMSFIKRQFLINKKKIVNQFHYKDWDSILKRPTNIKSFFSFMNSVHTHLISNSEFSKRSIVQCLNGITASGIYCTNRNIFDRIIFQKKVNVFLGTRYTRKNKSEFIENLEQYNFIFEMVSVFIKNNYEKIEY